MSDDVNTPPVPTLQGARSSGAVERQPWSHTNTFAPFGPLGEGREITYTLTPDDLAAARGVILRGGKSGYSLVRILIASSLVALTLSALVLKTQSSSAVRPSAGSALNSVLSGFVLPMLFPLLGLALLYLFFTQIMKTTGKKLLEHGDTQLLRLTPEYLYTMDPLHEGKTRWPRISALHEGKAHYFIQYTNQTFAPIPKRAFANEAEAKAFFDEMNALWRAGGGGTH